MASTEEEYTTKIQQLLVVENKEDAVRVTEEWGWDRVISWDDDLRIPLVKALISKVGKFFVEVPPFWFNVIINPGKFNELHSEQEDDLFVYETPLWARNLDHRPTEMVEQEASSYAIV